MADAARRAGDVEVELQALLLEFVARLELGEPDALRTLEDYRTLADRAQLPRGRYVGLTRLTTVAILQGRSATRSTSVARRWRWGSGSGRSTGGSVWCDQRWELARLRGDSGATEALLVELAGDPHMVVLELTVAMERGDLARAEALRLAVDELGRRWPRWAATIWLATEVELAAQRRDVARCEQLRAEVARRGEVWIVLAGAVVAHGPMSRLAAFDAASNAGTTLPRPSRAAAADAERLGARPWVVDARLGLAGALLGRAATGDTERARGLAEAAAQEAGELGMAEARARAADLGDRLAAELAGDVATSASPAGVVRAAGPAGAVRRPDSPSTETCGRSPTAV